jgi:hypothetical protein
MHTLLRGNVRRIIPKKRPAPLGERRQFREGDIEPTEIETTASVRLFGEWGRRVAIRALDDGGPTTAPEPQL